jgi:two-component system cell cycle sensor histidine kinase/response regulator CckA
MPLPLLEGDPSALLRALTRISRAVSDAASLDEIMQLAVEQGAALLGAERSLVLLRDDAGRLRIRAWYGLGAPRETSFPGSLDETLVARLATVLGEPSSDSVVAVPLVVRGRITGVIATALGESLEPNPAEAVLTALADQMAAPLENARMAEEVRQAQLVLENARLQDSERAARQAAEGGRDVLEAILQHIPEGIAIADAPDARIRVISRYGLASLERTEEEIVGLTAEERAARLPMYRGDAESPASAHELPLTRAIRDGTVIRAEEWSFQRGDGTRVPLLCNAGPIRDKEGTITGAIMAWQEIGSLKRMQEQLAQAQRLQAVGKLTGGVAHEVNNMMTVVIGFGHFVLQQLAHTDPRRKDVERMVYAGTRAAGITQQLLAFSRQQVLRPRAVTLGPLVNELAPLLKQVLGLDKGLELRLSPDPITVFADPGQLEQVLINLVANARDAMDPGGVVTMEVGTRMLDENYFQSHHGVKVATGPYALLMVTDPGTGMDAATKARVFEPFYTTKTVGEGTGLGLATVYGIVKQSDGYIWLYSEPGLGTSVKVYLPLTGPEEKAPPMSSEHNVPHGQEVVLVVEDESIVRQYTCRTLEELGYVVVEAASADEAMSILDQGTRVDLVLSDVVMPGLSARSMAESIARSHPTVQVLFVSGYPGEDVMRRGLLEPKAPFLQKPFSIEDLARTLRNLLDQARR